MSRAVTEQQRIDILVTNTKRQAILIENKLFAADQENQLVTYYQSLRTQGYREVRVVFLSLDERPPASHSLGHLEQLGT
ncbi:PD-(D/E)XK nuclease family protein [Vreelandella venusta]|uniref:PD-(D/E)XK nuclease family protein n=1 Tax=Vreelandella venusta TaxID=44935 RepID=UPI00385115C4